MITRRPITKVERTAVLQLWPGRTHREIGIKLGIPHRRVTSIIYKAQLAGKAPWLHHDRAEVRARISDGIKRRRLVSAP